MKEYKKNPADPLVSMGLCVRNGAESMRGAIDSLLAQTYKNFELIISDNASTDDTQKICEEYARRDPRIRYIRQKKDIGSHGNFDFVKKASRGDYFMYAGDDDLWDKYFVERSLEKFKEAPGAIMVFPNYYAFDDLERVIRLSPSQYFPFAQDLYGRLKAYLLLRCRYGKLAMIYGLWKRRTPIDKISLRESKSDMMYVFKCLSAGYFASIDEVLFFKRTALAGRSFADGANESNIAKRNPSIQFLTALPQNYELYKSVDEWYKIKKIANKVRGSKAKVFIADRLQATRYFYEYSQYIFQSSALTPNEKFRLFLWNLYAYIRSLRYGYM